jgi:hypothetical protein
MGQFLWGLPLAQVPEPSMGFVLVIFASILRRRRR